MRKWGGSKLLHSTDVSQQNQYLPNAAPEKHVTWILGEVLSPKQQGTFDILRHMLPNTVSRFILSHRQTWPYLTLHHNSQLIALNSFTHHYSI